MHCTAGTCMSGVLVNWHFQFGVLVVFLDVVWQENISDLNTGWCKQQVEAVLMHLFLSYIVATVYCTGQSLCFHWF